MHYAGIIKNDVVNGQDVCVSFWSQGCPNRCPGCHNPETWDFEGGIEKDKDELIEEVLDAIMKNGIQRNLSILGGEPLCDQNISFTQKLLSIAKTHFPNIKTFVWSGYKLEDLLKPENMECLGLIDYLVDGKYEMENRDITLPMKGSTNQRTINLKETLKNDNEVILWKP